MTKERARANTRALSRRTAIAGLAAGPTALLAAQREVGAHLPFPVTSTDAIAETPHDRLRLFAEITETTLPTIEYDDKGQIELTDALHDYIANEGAAFDWIFRGDLRAMVLTLRARLRPTPVMALFRKHQEFRAWMNSLPVTMTDAEIEPHYQKLFGIETEMMAVPSETAADFAAKAIVETNDGELLSNWETSEMWSEARELTRTDACYSGRCRPD